MIKSLLILIEHVEQCHAVLTKMYNSLKVPAELNRTLPAVIPPQSSSAREISFTDIEEGVVLLTIDDACARLGIVRATLFNLRQEGKITTVKKGRAVRFRENDVENMRNWYSIPKGKV
ncbi:helix-turn-helix domain-containing protein [Sphingobacterium olei]|uniref:Helix-turn-helix domain-containing protein n=1 Tax=Sphingobacterium olei TaxID=2571155 RepID=A0A4U0NID6_9SPHI|nr:helix-turn-helix domain-containing protein [Sphingobacterium olei]TJZ53773.1 helix-turn-helix domain-containing protein [Sphingobacterium olei]